MSSKMLMILIIWILAGNATGLSLPVLPPVTWALARQAQPEPTGACVVLAIDDSGSMQTNDPRLLRYSGARLFLSLLDSGDRAGVVRFSSRAQALFPSLHPAGTADEKQRLLEALITAQPDGYTDLLAALQRASDLLAGETCGMKALVVLSDGQPELPGGLPAGYEDQVLQTVQRSEAPLWGIALTRAGESRLLFRLAEATGGQVMSAESASDLLDAYLAVFAGIKDRIVLGSGSLAAPGASAFPLLPGLAPYVQRLTLVAAHDPGVTARLGREDGGAFQDLTLASQQPGGSFAFSTAEFAVFSADRPAPGAWQVRAEGSGSAWVRAILRSRLRVAVDDLPHLHPAGSPLRLEVRLVEEDDQGTATTWIGEAAFSARLTLPEGSEQGIDRFHDDGTNGDRTARDGIFTALYGGAVQEGTYRLRITGYKDVLPVQREVQVRAAVFPRLEITSPAPGGLEVDAAGGVVGVSARLAGGDPALLQVARLLGRVVLEGGGSQQFDLVPTPGGAYQGQFTPLGSGPHLVEVQAQGAVYRGQPYSPAAQVTLAVRLLPSIRLAEERLQVETVETADLARGVVIELDLISSSEQDEPLEVEAAGLPVGVALEVHPRRIPPGRSTLRLALRGTADPGSLEALLYLHARSEVQVTPRSLPLHLVVTQPVLEVRLPLRSPATLAAEQPLALPLAVESRSLRSETLHITYQGPGRISGGEFTLAIPAGGQQSAALEIDTAGLVPGEYRALLRLAGREGLQVVPGEIALQFTIAPAPWWQPLMGWRSVAGWQWASAGCALVLAGVGLHGLRRARPRPWGTLHLVRAPYGRPQQGQYALAELARGLVWPRVFVGSGGGDPLRLAGGSVLPGHLALRVARVQITRLTGRPPRPLTQRRLANVVENLAGGRVTVDGVPVPRGGFSPALRSGSKITVGDYEFVYRE